MANDKLLSVREVAERTQLPEKKIRRLIHEGKLPIIKIGYNIGIFERDVKRLTLEK